MLSQIVLAIKPVFSNLAKNVIYVSSRDVLVDDNTLVKQENKYFTQRSFNYSVYGNNNVMENILLMKYKLQRVFKKASCIN